MDIKVEYSDYEEVEQKPLILDSLEQNTADSDAQDSKDNVLSELVTVFFDESHGDQTEVSHEFMLGFFQTLDLNELGPVDLAIDEIDSTENVDELVHKCDYCFSHFSTLFSLRDHLKCHADVKCGGCSEVFHNTYERDCHSQTAHSSKRRSDSCLGVYQFCKCCHLGYATKNEIISHLRRCHMDFIKQKLKKEPTPSRSLESPSTAATESGAQSDNSQEENRKYLCHKCTMLITGRSHIRAHILYHKLSKGSKVLYYCSACPKTFENEVRFNQHMVSHAVEESDKTDDAIKCIYCHRKFKNIVNLRKHIMISHREIHYCHYCRTCHFTSTQLAKHQRGKHGVTPAWKCKGCEKVFLTASQHLKHSTKYCRGGKSKVEEIELSDSGETAKHIANDAHIRHCMLFEFNSGANAIDATKNICDIYPSALDVCECQKWFSRFKAGNFDLSDLAERGTTSDKDEFEVEVEVDSCQSMEGLSD